MMRKKLPIGIENFEEFSSENFYYVDKTLFIKNFKDPSFLRSIPGW